MLLGCPRVDVNCRAYDSDARTVLHLCCEYSAKIPIECIELLLKSPEIEVNHVAGWRRKTPLMVAIRNLNGHSSVECVELLLRDPKTDTSLRDDYTHSALDHILSWADEKDQLRLIKLLFESPTFDAVHSLKSKLETGRWDICKLVIESCLKSLYDNTLVQVWFEDFSGVDAILYQAFVGAIKWTTRLTHVSGKLSALLSTDVIDNNFSIIYLESMANYSLHQEKYWDLLYMVVRNRKAREKCFQAAFHSALFFRKHLGHDIANVIGRLVWETRGTKVWILK